MFISWNSKMFKITMHDLTHLMEKFSLKKTYMFSIFFVFSLFWSVNENAKMVHRLHHLLTENPCSVARE